MRLVACVIGVVWLGGLLSIHSAGLGRELDVRFDYPA